MAFYFYRSLPTTTTNNIKQQKFITTEMITPFLTSNLIVGRYTSPYVKAAKWLNSTSIDSSSINIGGTIKDSIKLMNNDDGKKKVFKQFDSAELVFIENGLTSRSLFLLRRFDSAK